MFHFSPQLVLLDIEGTTSSLAFVSETLFPYARRHLPRFLAENPGGLSQTLDAIARDAHVPDFAALCPHQWPSSPAVDWLVQYVNHLMDTDAKQTGLKQLQGQIWEAGYRDGTLRSHVFADVPVMLARWAGVGIPIAVYSSGSIAAQKFFFAYTEAGDLSPLFSEYFDTTTGPKRESASYVAIAKHRNTAPRQILFLSDIPEELRAAHDAGLATLLVERPGNHPVSETDQPRVSSFEEISLTP